MKKIKIYFAKEKTLQDEYELILPDNLIEIGVSEEEVEKIILNPEKYIDSLIDYCEPTECNIEISNYNFCQGIIDLKEEN